MSSLPASLTAALLVAAGTAGDWEHLVGELRLFMEAQQDTSRLQEVDQLNAQLLAIPAGRLSTGTRAPSEPIGSATFQLVQRQQ